MKEERTTETTKLELVSIEPIQKGLGFNYRVTFERTEAEECFGSAKLTVAVDIGFSHGLQTRHPRIERIEERARATADQILNLRSE